MESPGPVMACPLDAKICSDGSTVGRLAPSCEFAACPTDSSAVTYEVPPGYEEKPITGSASTIGVFVKPSLSESVSHTITISRYAIPAGKTANDVILANTRFQPADMQAESFER